MIKMMKRREGILLLLVVFACLNTMLVNAAGNTRKCYTITSGNTTVYSNTALTKKYGTIYGSDEITVITVTSAYTKVTYPVSRGTKTGYIKTSNILCSTGGTSYKARAKIITYRRPGGTSYGYISNGDTVTVLGTNGNYVQVKYPVSYGYKYAWVTKDAANSYIYSASYAMPNSGKYVLVTAMNNAKALDVNGGYTSNGTNIQLWDKNGTSAQTFTITSVGNGWYTIRNTASNKSIDVTGGTQKSNVNVQLYSYNGTDAQLWRFYNAGNGYYYIQNKLGYYLDVSGGSTSNGANIIVYSKNGGNNQKWKLISPSSTVTTTTYYVTTKAGLYLRSKASTSASALLTMPYGAAVQVSSISNGWATCTYNGKTGYASSLYLSKTKPSTGTGTTNTSNGYVINGVNIGYAAGSYFTDNGKACTDHGTSGIHSYSNEKACNCICTYNGKSLGAVQCFGFARYVQSKLYGVNSYNSPNSFYKMSGSYVAAGSLTATKIKSIISSAKVGAHIRTNGSAHSMIVTSITSTGFSVIQCNGSNNKEYSGYYACRIGTYTYTWSSYANSTYGKRGINFVEIKK
jgi:hypothetical protein